MNDQIQFECLNDSFVNLLILFFIGLYLQIKIIKVSIETKGVNWKVDIQHSIIMIVFFSVRICFEMVTYFIHALHQYTGNWYCYIILFVNQFGMVSVFFHSLIIATYKYIYGIHNTCVRSTGEDKANLISGWISIIISAVFAISLKARPSNIPHYSFVLNCVDVEVEKDTQTHKPWIQKLKTVFTCGLVNTSNHDRNEIWHQFINIISMAGCSLTSVLLSIIVLNVFEVFLYCRLFEFAKRYLLTSFNNVTRILSHRYQIIFRIIDNVKHHARTLLISNKF